MRRLKAFIIATFSIAWVVEFKKKKRVQIHFKRNEHKVLFRFLDLFFDVRVKPNGEVWLNLKQRVKANYERGI
ncbi:MAG: hypothetical protein HYV29_01740 [Ignavibacteriales bacterium]|nr:hypothetical protein [Ignavibacteriales bacterium]